MATNNDSKMYTLEDFETFANENFREHFEHLKSAHNLTFEACDRPGYHTEKLNAGFVLERDEVSYTKTWLLLKLPDTFHFYKENLVGQLEEYQMDDEDEKHFESHQPFKKMPRQATFHWGALCWPLAAYFFLAHGKVESIGNMGGRVSPQLFQQACTVFAERKADSDEEEELQSWKNLMAFALREYDEIDPEAAEEFRKYCRTLFGNDQYAGDYRG